MEAAWGRRFGRDAVGVARYSTVLVLLAGVGVLRLRPYKGACRPEDPRCPLAGYVSALRESRTSRLSGYGLPAGSHTQRIRNSRPARPVGLPRRDPGDPERDDWIEPPDREQGVGQ